LYADIYTKQNLTKAFDIRVAKLGDGFVAAWRDITERKQAEERLRLLESVVAAYVCSSRRRPLTSRVRPFCMLTKRSLA